MKNIAQAVVAASLFTLAGTAAAVPISGSIGFTGAYTHNGTNLNTATEIAITGNTATLGGSITGTFADLGLSDGDTATYQNFTFNPTGPVAAIWSVDNPGGTGSVWFNLTSMTVKFQSANLLALSGKGEFDSDIDGLDASMGEWTFTANETGANLTFSSSTTTETPEPGVALLLGAGLLGFGASRKLRKS